MKICDAHVFEEWLGWSTFLPTDGSTLVNMNVENVLFTRMGGIDGPYLGVWSYDFKDDSTYQRFNVFCSCDRGEE